MLYFYYYYIVFLYLVFYKQVYLCRDVYFLFLRVELGIFFYNELKFIVFFFMLLFFFIMVCFKCKKSKLVVIMKQRGIMVIVFQYCFKCGENVFYWRLQLLIFGNYLVGNIFLSFGVFMVGVFISKILLVFRYMGLFVYCFRIFFVY